MAKFELLYFGKSKYSFIQEGEDLFIDRLRHYYPMSIRSLSPKYRSKTKHEIQKTEADVLFKLLDEKAYLVLLDENGKTYTSRKFAEKLEHLNAYQSKVIFVIGGAFGFHNNVYARANEKLSLSSMTFSHQLIKLVFLEQYYRACTIIRGEKYHND